MQIITRLGAIGLLAGTMLVSVEATSQEIPPRQVGTFDINAVTIAPLWAMHQSRYSGTVEDAIAELTALAAEGTNANSASPGVVVWQAPEPVTGITDHLIATEVRADEEIGKGAIITAHVFADGPDTTGAHEFADMTGETIASAVGGEIRAEASGTSSVSINATRSVDASFDTVWRVLVDEFGDVAQWSSLISENTFFAGENDGLLGAKRTCFIPSFGAEVEEKVVVSDRDAGHFAYEVLSGMPPFAQNGRADWRMIDLGNGRTEVTAVISFGVADGTPGLPIGMAKQNFANVLEISIDELVYYTANGEPHPRELASR